MAFYHRKFLLAGVRGPDKKPEDDKKYESACYMCYDCPECKQYLSPPPPSPPAQKHQLSTILILTVCVLGAVFLFLSYLTIRRYRSRLRNSRRRDSPPLENDNLREDFIDELQGPVIDHPIWYIRTVGLPQSVIDSIAVFKYKKGEGLIEGSDCSVCLNEFQEDESLRLLPKCSHAFHVPCIDTWLRSHKNCPMCRAPILISNTNAAAEVNSVATGSSNSGSSEEIQVESEVETGEEMRRGTENSCALLVQDDKLAEVLSKGCWDINTRNGKFRVLSDLTDHRVTVDQELQPVRRSISMDFSSASTIITNIHAERDEGCWDTKLAIVEKQDSDVMAKRGSRNSSICELIKSSSYRCSLQKGPISMKRSFSFSGKHYL
ncbi:hypothetical protein Pfo_007860 [Paulownia fortunei]|nr:hypothetical protein Pfo_007860 [Paulownia fortunei]